MEHGDAELFLEAVEKDYQEAVIGKQISPAARAEVMKQKRLHRKVNVKKDEGNPELHLMSPMDNKKKKEVQDVIKHETKDIVVYDPSDKKNAVTPDHLWGMAPDDKKGTLTILNYPKTKETFYVSDDFNNDLYNLHNYDASNPNNPLNDIPKGESEQIRSMMGGLEMSSWAKTHSESIRLLSALLSSSTLSKTFKINRDDVIDSKKQVSRPGRDVLLGRGLKGVDTSTVSFWNRIDSDTVQKIVDDVSKKVGVDYDTIYVASNNQER